LFELLGLASAPKNGEYPCGKGKVYVLRTEPKTFVLEKDRDGTYFSTVKKAYETTPNTGALETKNNFYLERGPYIIASVVDEGISSDPLALKGLFIDLFDPELPVLQTKTVQPDEQAYLYDVAKIADKSKPAVLCGASRIYDEVIQKGYYSFVAKSPANTNNVSRIYLPKQPEKVKATNKAGETLTSFDSTWDNTSKTCLLKFENDPEGVTVSIDF
jgi:hypothetical protein